MITRYALILFVSLFISNLVSAQENSNKRIQSWTDVTLRYNFDSKWSIGGDVGIRSIFPDPDWHTFYIRPSLNYYFNPSFRVTAGIGSFHSQNKNINNVNELRFFQDFTYSGPDLGWVDLFHRIRFEERIFYHDNFKNYWDYRARYLLRIRSNSFGFFGSPKNFEAKVMWELFAPLQSVDLNNLFNSQRYYAVLVHRPNSRFRYELCYIHQSTKEMEAFGFMSSEEILRLRFFYVFNKY